MVPYAGHGTGSRAAAFTIIEMLVVVALVGLLTAILVHALGSVRASARLARCSTSLREVARSLSAIAAEDRDTLPLNLEPWTAKYATTFGVEIADNPQKAWVASLHRHLGMNGEPWMRGLRCPNAVDADPAYFPGDAPANGRAGSAWLLNSYCSRRTMSSIASPSDGVLVVESGIWTKLSQDSGKLAFPTEPHMYPHPTLVQQPSLTPWRWPFARHQRSVAWVDGHVSSESASRWPTGDETLDPDRVRHMRFRQPGQSWVDP